MNSVQVQLSDADEALKCVSSAIREADMKVFGPAIGGYELLHEFRIWLQDFTDPFTRPSDQRQRLFRKHVAGKFGHGPGKKYFDSMIAYYDACK